MTKGGDVVATLCDREAKGIAIAIHIDPVQSLVMSRCVTLAPKPIPRARVIHTPAAFQGGDDRLLYVFSIATIPPEIESDKTYGSRLELVETKGVRDSMVYSRLLAHVGNMDTNAYITLCSSIAIFTKHKRNLSKKKEEANRSTNLQHP